MRTIPLALSTLLAATSYAAGQGSSPPVQGNGPYATSICQINEDHARRPGKVTEKDLA